MPRVADEARSPVEQMLMPTRTLNERKVRVLSCDISLSRVFSSSLSCCAPPPLVQFLTQVPDPRKRRGRGHSLVVALVIAVGAVTAGAKSLTSIGEQANAMQRDDSVSHHSAMDVGHRADVRGSPKVIRSSAPDVRLSACG